MKKISGLIIGLVFSFGLQAQISMEKQNDGIVITENNNKVLFYQIQPKSNDGEYARNNYIHPLWAPDGTVLTEDFPADHLHHRGVFWAWHQVWINGKRIGDPWEIKNFEQEVSTVEFIKLKNGNAQLKTDVNWLSDLWVRNNKKVPYINEKSVITIHPLKNNYRQIDFEIQLLANEENLFIGGSEDVKGYSGFSVRMKLPDDVQFTGPNGIVEPQKTAVQSNGFINISGRILNNNKKGGIVIIDHKNNPGYPQKWILRSQRSMQNAAFPGNTKFPLSTSSPLVLNYSIIVYSGKISNKIISKIASEK